MSFLAIGAAGFFGGSSSGLAGIVASSAIGAGIGVGVSTAANPLLNASNQKFNELLPIAKPTPAELININFRHNGKFPKFQEWMRTWGLNEEVEKAVVDAQKVLLNAADMIILYRRGLLDKDTKKNEEKFYSNMERIGIFADTAKQMLEATLNYESPQEIILWLVREVLDPEKRKLLNLDEDYPKAADDFAAKNGIPIERMRNIWAAHWINASPEQLARTLQRYHPENRKYWEKEVTEIGLDPNKVATDIQQMKDLLKFNDVAPYYREKIAALAFDDLGVIEIRWMIRFKFVKLDEAIYLYQRRGLPKEIAKRVVQVVFVVQSITDWQDSIKLGAMKFEDVLAECKEWGIEKKELLDVVKRKVAPQLYAGVEEERKFTKELIKDGYINGIIDRTKAISLLNGLNFSDEQTKIMLEVWDISREKKESAKVRKEKDLAKADIRKRFISGLASEIDTRTELKEQGFNNSAIDDLLELWKLEEATKKK